MLRIHAPKNDYGHIIEIREDGDDHTAREFKLGSIHACGRSEAGRLVTSIEELQPGKLASEDTYFAGYTKAADLSRIGSPDNVGFDLAGNLWIVTDGTQPQA